ncbi:MAG TPA: hypothetical protein VNA88_02010 [Candidatus Kapabacteria bacterium]|nr:hypothetical protein [Candidatus Kapabacteria bacterium]
MSKLVLRAVALLALFASMAISTPLFAQGAADDHTVLILNSSVSGGMSSDEAIEALGMGMTVELASDVQWAAKSAADFATYRAIILGDPNCSTNPGVSLAAATANTLTWGPAVTGNIFIIGSDPVLHNKVPVTNAGIAFAIADANKTGLYMTLSCYYYDAGAFTPVPSLAGLGTFTIRGVGCYDNAHITATHPALAGLTDAYMSGWGCTVHETFDTWPVTFQVLAIARDAGAVYTAPDGSVGVPFILARGATVISDISIEPLTATGATGTDHTLTATVTEDDVAVMGASVTFTVISGPNAGATSTSSTDDGGQTTWTFSSALTGTDLIRASFVDGDGTTQTSDVAEMVWTEPVMEIIGQPEDQTVCTGGSASFTVTTIGDDLSFAWYKDGLGALADGGNISGASTATLTISPATTADAGDYYVVVSGPGGELTSEMATLTVHAPPTITVTVDPSYLWPPNHSMIPITATVVTTGDCGPLTVELVSVTSNEPDNANGNGDGNTVDDIQGVDTGADYAFSVRAERAAGGTGRVYTVTYRVTDAAGNEATGTATISVPLNQR